MRAAQSAEDRILRAFRQAGIITAAQQQTARDLLEATEPCARCALMEHVQMTCPRCDGTGEQLVIR